MARLLQRASDLVMPGKGWMQLRPPPPQSPAPPTGLVVAHRGGLAHSPENSLVAIRRAADLGADAVELDVRWTNGALICAHDAGQPGPHAADALALALDLNLRVEFDLKSYGHDPAVPAVVHLLQQAARHDRIWVSTFHPYAAWKLRWQDPEIVVGWAIATSMVHRIPLWTGWSRWLGAQVLEPEAPLITPARLAAWQRLGFVVETWSAPHDQTDHWLEQGVNVVVDRLRP